MTEADRITELERRVAHFERIIEEMSDVMTEQGKQIDLLTLHLRRTRERLADMEAGWERSPQDDKPPPHY